MVVTNHKIIEKTINFLSLWRSSISCCIFIVAIELSDAPPAALLIHRFFFFCLDCRAIHQRCSTMKNVTILPVLNATLSIIEFVDENKQFILQVLSNTRSVEQFDMQIKQMDLTSNIRSMNQPEMNLNFNSYWTVCQTWSVQKGRGEFSTILLFHDD